MPPPVGSPPSARNDVEPSAAASPADEASGDAERPKSFGEKVWQISFAPRDLLVVYSIKFAETTAYFAFSYIYAPFLSEELGMTDVEAGMLDAPDRDPNPNPNPHLSLP